MTLDSVRFALYLRLLSYSRCATTDQLKTISLTLDRALNHSKVVFVCIIGLNWISREFLHAHDMVLNLIQFLIAMHLEIASIRIELISGRFDQLFDVLFDGGFHLWGLVDTGRGCREWVHFDFG